MRTSNEISTLIAAEGGEIIFISGGTSYRSGGSLVVTPAGWQKSPTPVRVEKTTLQAFDPTGYDGRGRSWEIFRLVPDPNGMLPVSEGLWSSLSNENRTVIGGNGSSKSQSGAIYFGRPDTDQKNDINSIMADLLSTVKVPPVVVTRHPALVELLKERGLIESSCRVIDHANVEDVRGQDVIGILPLSLAALARSVTEIPLALTPEMRGKELDLKTLLTIAGPAVTYTVMIKK